jgi:type I restriction enzyme, S subunit
MSEWTEIQLSQLVAFQKGRKVDTSPFPSHGFAAYLGASGIEGRSDGYAAMQFAVRAEPTDILMLWDGERSGLVGFGKQGVVASTVSKLTPNGRMDPQYLFFALSERFGWIQHRRTGTGVPHVPKDLGRILKLRYPTPLSTQRKIASILTAINNAIEKTEALISKYQQIKTGLMHDLFTRGVLPNGQLRPPRSQAPALYKETPIGWIPNDWLVSKLGTMAKIVSGVTLGSKTSPTNNIDAPYLRVANVQDGYLDLREIKTVSVSRKTLEYLCLLPDDILMNEGGDFDKLGRGAVWAGEIEGCVHQNHVFRVRTDSAVLRSHYLAYYSESSFGKKYFLLSSKQSTNLASINSTQLNAYPIALPQSTEQDAIISRISNSKGRIDTLKAEAEKLHAQKLGLMQDLLTGKVPVQVDETAPAHA